ncbi:MAG: DNA repair protein RecN [Ruminococcaceae bacterium]|nr:DNA repair protein RecN [Oscillospiraceae bacterium]
MLESLHIENVAVVKSLDIEFTDGMIALTGETGAGKSIIVDSLNLLLGSRADKELIRSGENKAEVIAVFGRLSADVLCALEEMGFESDDGKVMLSRSITQSSSAARINGRPVTLALLREASSMIFGIHGQNDNLRLLDPKNHIEILDTYAANKQLREEYSQVYRRMLHLEAEIDMVSKDAREQMRLREMLKFQVDDIDAAKLKQGEEEVLEALVARLKHAERITKCCALVQKALEGGKGMGAIYLTDRASSALDSISDALPEAEALASRLAEVKYELEDIAASVGALVDDGDGDPTAKLDKAEARLDTIARLKRKYGSTVEEILAFRKDAATKLEYIDTADDRKAELEEKLAFAREEAKDLAKKLSTQRRKAAHGLTLGVKETLAFLDMPKVAFEVSINSSSEFDPYGTDKVEFLISANVGEPLMPMEKIASGGELARIMLSLKTVLNLADGIDTVIFDEIDAGISGKTSRKVGIKLKEIGKNVQVICVTHSAQIASLAHTHLFVEKSEKDGRTQSNVRELLHEERILEIARILGGINVTEFQLAAAREMVAEGESY